MTTAQFTKLLLDELSADEAFPGQHTLENSNAIKVIVEDDGMQYAFLVSVSHV